MSLIKKRPVSKDSVKRVLENLPKDLDDTYDQMFLRIDSSHREQAMRVLAWIAVAPIRILVALFTRASMVKFRSVDEIKAKESSLDSSMPLIEESGHLLESTSADDIVALLPSLIVIEGASEYLAFVHSSLLDYLLSRDIRAMHKDLAVRDFALDLTEARLQVADAAFRLYIQAKKTATTADYSDLEEGYCASMEMVLYQAVRIAELIKLPNWPASWHRLVIQVFFDAEGNPDMLPQTIPSGRMVPLEFAIHWEYVELLDFFSKAKWYLRRVSSRCIRLPKQITQCSATPVYIGAVLKHLIT